MVGARPSLSAARTNRINRHIHSRVENVFQESFQESECIDILRTQTKKRNN